MKDTIIFLLGLSLLAFLTFFICYDFYLASTNQVTFSVYVRNWTKDNANNPQVFVMVGLAVGFSIGAITGFILGHLFWS